jgi:Kef-type K+ transport system membrane component KefB
VLAGFFFIILLAPLFLDMVMRPHLEREPGDLVHALAICLGVLLSAIGFPFLGVGAILVGFVAVSGVMLTYRSTRKSSLRRQK